MNKLFFSLLIVAATQTLSPEKALAWGISCVNHYADDSSVTLTALGIGEAGYRNVHVVFAGGMGKSDTTYPFAQFDSTYRPQKQNEGTHRFRLMLGENSSSELSMLFPPQQPSDGRFVMTLSRANDGYHGETLYVKMDCHYTAGATN